MRSKLEKTCKTLLECHNILFEYEGQTVTLQEGFNYNNTLYQREGKKFKEYKRKIRPITYTPDFVGDGWVIETKGFERNVSKIKWKMFKKYLMSNDISVILFKPHTKKEILECIKVIQEKCRNKKITCLTKTKITSIKK